jgi:hypothetical protein
MDGVYEAAIKEAEITKSKNSGANMIKISIDIRDKTFFYYLVEGEYFDFNATRFFSCFNIEKGNFNLAAWKGKVGKVELYKPQGSKYFQIKELAPREHPVTNTPAASTNHSVKTSETFITDIPF